MALRCCDVDTQKIDNDPLLLNNNVSKPIIKGIGVEYLVNLKATYKKKILY